MNLKEMTTQELTQELGKLGIKLGLEDSMLLICINSEIQRRLEKNSKQQYVIQYKWEVCDVEIEKSPAFTVWGTSPIDAAQTLVDANNWRGQDMEFLVCLKGSDNSTCFTSKELE